MAKKQTAYRIEATIQERLKKAARIERRSINNLVEIILEDWLDEFEKQQKPGH